MSSITDLHVPSIKQVDGEMAPLAPAVASLIAAIAGSDGAVAPQEYAAALSIADEVACLCDDPAVFRSLALRAFNSSPKPIDEAFREVAKFHADLPQADRETLLKALFPLFSTQGEQARPLARRTEQALHIERVGPLLDSVELPPETGAVSTLLRRATHMLGTSTPRLCIANEIVEFTGDTKLTRLLQADRRERDGNLDAALASAVETLASSLEALEQSYDGHEEKLDLAHSLDRQADELDRQFKARLRSIEKRISLLRRHVEEDIQDMAEGGGDEAEVDLRRLSERRGLLRGNDDRDARERVIAKGLARRHERLKQRYDAQIQLLRDELSEYRDDYIEAAQETVAPVRLADWRLATPGPTLGARVKDALDHGANRALAGGAMAAAGTAGAVGAGWIAPAAVAGVVAAPVGAAVVAVVAVAGVWKLYANREERLRSEHRTRAEAVRTVAYSKAQAALTDVSCALDEITEGFRNVSMSRIAPLRHDAERIREMCKLQKEVGYRISHNARQRLERWQRALQAG